MPTPYIELKGIHTDNDCGGNLAVIDVGITSELAVLVVGKCEKCGDIVGLSYPLTRLYKWSKKFRAEIKNKVPLVPPLALPPAPVFSENDTLEAHGLSIVIPPDEEAA